MTDRVFVTGLALHAYHGVMQHEAMPYHDKSSPEEIYSFFAMSKKTFKMTTGALYKQRKIEFTESGIKLIEK